MTKKLMYQFLLQSIAGGMIPTNHPDIFNKENISFLQNALTNLVEQNYTKNGFLENEKNNLLDVIGILRFHQKFSSVLEKEEMFNWCNEMIGLLNQTKMDNVIDNRLALFVEHGYEIKKTLEYEDYLLIKKEVLEMTKLEYQILSYLQNRQFYMIPKEFLISSQVEHCIYYLITKSNDEFSTQEYSFFLNLLEIKKQLLNVSLKSDWQKFYIKLNELEQCILSREEMMNLQEKSDLSFILNLQSRIDYYFYEKKYKKQKVKEV